MHHGTLFMAIRILTNLLRYPQLLEKFRDGSANGGWLSDADSVIRNRAAVIKNKIILNLIIFRFFLASPLPTKWELLVPMSISTQSWTNARGLPPLSMLPTHMPTNRLCIWPFWQFSSNSSNRQKCNRWKILLWSQYGPMCLHWMRKGKNSLSYNIISILKFRGGSNRKVTILRGCHCLYVGHNSRSTT